MLEAILVVGGIGLVSSLGLGVASQKFAVETDPKIDELERALPGANCGACGYVGCRAFAEAVISEEAPPSGCLAGGESVATAIAHLLGIDVELREKVVAQLVCLGGEGVAQAKYKYLGIGDCQAGYLLAGGDKSCRFGCLGLGSCIRVCPVDAISNDLSSGLVQIDRELCIGCGKCLAVCPKSVLELVPASQQVKVLCHSQDKGPIVRKLCRAGCLGCGLCKKVCPEKAITLEKFLAAIDPNICNVCGTCVKKCPTKCIGYISDVPPELTSPECQSNISASP